MTLRERIALAMYDEIRQNDHGLGKQTVTGVNFDRVADAILALQGSDFLIVTEQGVKSAVKATMNKWLDGCSDDEWNREADEVWNALRNGQKT